MTTQVPGPATQTSMESVRTDGIEAGHVRPPTGATPSTAPSGISTGYVAAWAVIGAISAGYLAVTAWGGTPPSTVTMADPAYRIDQISSDVAELKAQVADMTKAAEDDRTRLTALETTVETRLAGLAGSAAKLAAAPEPAPQITTQSDGTAKTVTVPGVLLTKSPASPSPSAVPPTMEKAAASEAKATPSLPRAPTKIIAAAPVEEAKTAKSTEVAEATKATGNKKAEAKASDAFKPFRTTTQAGAAIETGSLPPRATNGPVGIEVASAGSLDSARQSWGGITSRAGDALAGTEARIMPSIDGTSFRVIAGPYQNEADAQKACAALKARGIACRATGFGGAPL